LGRLAVKSRSTRSVGRSARLVGDGRPPSLAAHDTLQVLAAHQPLDRAARNLNALAPSWRQTLSAP
jgi:hypothetical protein